MDLTQEFRRIDRLPLSRSEALPRFPGWRTLYAMHASGDGIVYRATPDGNDSADADYVVKTLGRDAAQRPERRAAFQREALAAGAVRHAHLIPLLDGDLRGERPFLVFPFLEGSTLRQAVSHRMPLSLPSALWTIRQSAEALIALHEAGFAHLDVKPENVHLSPRGHVTLLDLGSARRIDSEAGDYSGDVAYAAPELWSSACVVDGTADVYSLGLTAYEALAGVPPCEAASADDWIAFHKQCESLDLREYLPNLPVELVQLLQAMLRKTPARRPTLEDVRDELVRLEIGSFNDRRALLRPFDPDEPKTPDASIARKSRSQSSRSASTDRASRAG